MQFLITISIQPVRPDYPAEPVLTYQRSVTARDPKAALEIAEEEIGQATNYIAESKEWERVK